jgi:prepilin-type N-terminal cleavage/methylation domain-containing protein
MGPGLTVSTRPQTAGRTADRGFTLVELLIVIVVLGILAGITVFGVARFRSDATAAACAADVATVTTAAHAYDVQTGNYPASVEALVAGKYLKSAPSGRYAFDGTAKTVSRDPACAPGPTAAATTTAATGRFTGLNGNCVDLADLSGADTTAVRLATCNGGAGQQWAAPASYPGAVKVLGKCLDVSGGGRENNTRVQLYVCNSTGAQVWTLQSGGTLLNPQSGKCLSTAAPGAQLYIFDCGTGSEQRWSLS